jgi:hypothetical protein
LNALTDVALPYELKKQASRPRGLESSMLKKRFRRMEGKLNGGERRMHNEELHNLNSSLDVIRKSEKLKWPGNAARMRTIRNAYALHSFG